MRVGRVSCVSVFLSVILGLASLEAFASRFVLRCSDRWDFKAGESEVWRQVNVPHDATVDRQPIPCPDLGDHGYVSGGRFFYRKSIATPSEAVGAQLSLRFDGVYYDSIVSVNGAVVGGRKSGYLPFEVSLDAGRMTNLVEVTVDARTPNTRWNPGAGLLRNVALVTRRGFSLEPDRVFVRTVSADAKRAELQVSVEGAEIVSPKDGRLVIANPSLWCPEDPFLYEIKVVARGKNGEDSLTIPYGIRTFAFTKDNGFFLNGRHYPIRGVCQHEGEPCFGAQLNEVALEYSLCELKKLGVNAIRTAHHPFPPEFYALCDRLGFLVMDELFDQWREPKTTQGVSTFFEAEWRKDVETIVRRDRNHPCVILWSIGNEIPELGAPQYGGRHGRDGARTALEMRNVIRQLDPTRPVTAGLNGPQWAEENGVLSALDVCGLNYSPEFYDKFRGKYALVGAETAATYSLRDVYCYQTNGSDLVVVRHTGNLADAHSMIPVWGVPEQGQEATLKRQMTAPWSAGEFTWCSFDYLGEGSNPLSKGTDHWPCVGSSWGMYDFAGLPKDRAFLYQAMWTEKPMAHLLPDWTLPGCEGKNVPVWCYTNGDEAELYLNGVSQGVRRRADTTDLHLAWAVPYAPGVLRVEARRNGKTVAVDERRTAGPKATVNRTVLFERGDVRLVRYDAVDKDGNRVITCEDEIDIDPAEGELLAAANGSPLETTNRRAHRRRLFRGSCAAWFRGESRGRETSVVIRMLPDEKWWGTTAANGSKMPYSEQTRLTVDLRKSGGYNVFSSLLVSSCGRSVWCDETACFEFSDGTIRVIPARPAPVEVRQEGTCLRDAFRAVAARHFPASGKMPDPLFISAPQYCTWIELTYHQNEKDILAYAQSMLDNGLPPGVLMIDDTWQADYGDWRFEPSRFANPKDMLDRLHAQGFKVLLWTCPWVSMDSPAFRRIAYGVNPDDVKGYPTKGGFLMSGNEPAADRWWNGFSALLDFTHPNARAWFAEQLDRLVADYGVDGFKFDGGELESYVRGYRANDTNVSPVEVAAAYARFAERCPLAEFRNGWDLHGRPVVGRLLDKDHSWEALRMLVPDLIAGGLLGNSFLCPDMIGGGQWTTFLPGAPFDPELFIRSVQVHLLCGMMQFSASPWRVLNAEKQQIVRDLVRLRQERFASRFVTLAEECGRTGEPMIRSLEYVFPHQGYANVKDEFMMGDTLLVTPQMEKGKTSRSVILPPGVWRADDGTEHAGGRTIEVATPLARLPYFEKEI